MWSLFSKKAKDKKPVSLAVTLWPAFDHFLKFANYSDIQGIRLNSAMMSLAEIDDKFEHRIQRAKVPLWFDIKGMQMRIKEVVKDHHHDHLEFILNRSVKVQTPCPVHFKGGEDAALLLEIRNGNHFIFKGGPRNEVRAGESIHIRRPELEVLGPPLLNHELEKIKRIKSLGINNWYLSYVYSQDHVDAFREVIGKDANLILKIENQAGLDYVANDYEAMPNTQLAVARGDLYVEVDQPHLILNASKMIIEKDPNAIVGSRMLLSIFKNRNGVPSSADICELAWLYDVGFRNFLLCDEICLTDQHLSGAVGAFSAFRKDYCDAS